MPAMTTMFSCRQTERVMVTRHPTATYHVLCAVLSLASFGASNHVVFYNHGASPVVKKAAELEFDGERPIVYSAKGTHANYWKAGRYDIPPGWIKSLASRDDINLSASLKLLGPSPMDEIGTATLD